jgi:hypothetical protein
MKLRPSNNIDRFLGTLAGLQNRPKINQKQKLKQFAEQKASSI